MTDLISAARRINDREEAITILKRQTLDKAAEALREVLLQGADLVRVKNTLRHGQWLPWLIANCPAINPRTAQGYMRLAADPTRVGELAAGSIRQALALLDDEPAQDNDHKETKRWPPYLEAVGRLSKLAGYIERFPVEQWPREGLEKFRADLQPIAARLWPDKF